MTAVLELRNVESAYGPIKAIRGVSLQVRKGVTLGGAECTIIGAATGADHPDATFVLVEPDGAETTC